MPDLREKDIRNMLIEAIKHAEILEHPDTLNTFSAYQVLLPNGNELWVNRRNGIIFGAGKSVNRI